VAIAIAVAAVVGTVVVVVATMVAEWCAGHTRPNSPYVRLTSSDTSVLFTFNAAASASQPRLPMLFTAPEKTKHRNTTM
jgi:hypothetical protein